MFARTSTWSGSPEALQKWAEGGTALTLWDSADAAAATDQFAEQSRAATVAATGTELNATGRYEVVARV